MPDPVAWLWSFADFEDAVFDETSMRIIVGTGFDRLAAANFMVHTGNAEYASCPSCFDGHVEEIVVLDWPDGTRRYFVPSPEYLCVEVARGLTWADGVLVTSHVARSTRPIVFVGDRLPPTAMWPGQVPPVVTLSQVTAMGESGLLVDRDAVVAAIPEADSVASDGPSVPTSPGNLALMIVYFR